jgi:hypothetical protein
VRVNRAADRTGTRPVKPLERKGPSSD